MKCCNKKMVGACWKEDRILRYKVCENYKLKKEKDDSSKLDSE